MMSRSTSRRLASTSFLVLILLSGSGALFVNCTPNDHAKSPPVECGEDHEHHEHHEHHHHHPDGGALGTAPNVIYCTTLSNCTDSVYFPTCGDSSMVTCIAPNSPPGAPKECVYRVSEDAGCFCLERDISACGSGGGTGGGSQGIQHCLATGGWTTGWGGCGGT